VLGTVQSIKKYLKQGCHIQIDSEFLSTTGLASSAAVTVATLSALSEWIGLSFSTTELIKNAREIVRDVQGIGSGADVAACVLGGVVFYRAEPFIAEKLPYLFPITVIYSGYKTPTPVAIKSVQEKFASDPEFFSQLMQSINTCVLNGMKALRDQDWKTLGINMKRQQEYMDALGVNTDEMKSILRLLHDTSGISGAKISGSGMGDCVIAMGECILDEWRMPSNAMQIKVNMTSEGVRCEKV
jgi:mevalonate kinase